MNKKIKIIDLFNKIANKEELPKNIKYNNEVFWLNKKNVYVGNELYLIDLIDEEGLNDYVEILEDGTEEIEEIDVWRLAVNEDDYKAINDTLDKFGNKINELVKEFNKMRKDLNK